jgi:hypothetical protein
LLQLLVLAAPSTRLQLRENAAPGPEVSWLRIAAYLGALTWTVTCLWLGSSFLAGNRLPLWRWTEVLAALPSLLLIDLAVHECGHIAAGWCAGFRFERICIGPLLVRRVEDGWGFSLHPAMSWGGGFALATPRDARRVRPGLLMFFAGGPAASLLLAAGCLMAFVTSPGTSWAPWAHPIGLLAAWSSYSFLANCNPVCSKTVRTDGAWIVELARGSALGQRLCAHYAMAASEHSQVRPADWSPNWIRHALGVKDHSADRLAALLLAYRHHLDRGEIILAGRFLDEAVNLQHRLPANFSTRRLWLERAYFLARHRSDAVNSREALERGRRGLPVERPLLLRATCAVQLAEGDVRAVNSLQLARQCRGGLQLTGNAAFEQRLIATLEA